MSDGEARRARDLEYQRQWRAANPEKQREYARRYRERYPDRAAESVRRYRAANPEKVRERTRRYRAGNLDALKLRDRRRHRERPGRRNAEMRRVEALKVNHGMTAAEWDALWDGQAGRCYLCGDPMNRSRPRLTVIDHDHACCPSPKTCRACRRGLVHSRCNVLIGTFGDDPVRLRQVAANLERAQATVEIRRRGLPVQGALWTVEAEAS